MEARQLELESVKEEDLKVLQGEIRAYRRMLGLKKGIRSDELRQSDEKEE